MIVRNISFVVLATLFLTSPAVAGVVKIDVTPTDVGSTSSTNFSQLPTTNPGVFGFTGDVRGVNFDSYLGGSPIPDGTTLTSQFSSIGVQMSGVRTDSSVLGGPASSPNTTFTFGGNLFSFNVPVVAVGIINTTPDRDLVEIWSGPNRTGTLLLSFLDTFPDPRNLNIDRFVGAFATGGDRIGSLFVQTTVGALELDELIFVVPSTTVIPEPGTLALFGLGLAAAWLVKRRKR